MSNEIDYSQPSTEFYNDLIENIEKPEPICLLLVKVDLTQTTTRLAKDGRLTENIKSKLPEAVMYVIRERLKENLRQYDFLSRVEKYVIAVALRTLAEESELQKRVEGIKEVLQQPYNFQEVQASIDLKIGSAIRQMGESPSALLSRADLSIQKNSEVVPPFSYKQKD